MLSNLPRKSSLGDVGGAPQPSRGGGSALQSIGSLLRERREAMGVSLAEVEVATRIRQKYLSALEADDWNLLPGEVVGRGFLRNYADYLGLEPQEVMDRRRATTDVGLTQVLSTTSAGAPLPPERAVDYRLKEVDLKDEGDGIQRGEIRLTPILAILGVAVAVGLFGWGLVLLSGSIGQWAQGAQVGVASWFDRPDPTPTLPVAGVVNAENLTPGATDAAGASAATPETGVVVLGSGGDASITPVVDTGAGGQVPQNTVILVPTATPDAVVIAPTLELPTPTPIPPTPIPPTPIPPTPIPPTPIPPTPVPPPPPDPLPTVTPVPAPPPVSAAACPDLRSVISSPGVNQVVSGIVPITGAATHEAFQYYKLEFAPGANAGGGFVYFDGSNVQIPGGVLGNFNTPALANGEYTIRLTVVDQSGNFPPPCDVTVAVQN